MHRSSPCTVTIPGSVHVEKVQTSCRKESSWERYCTIPAVKVKCTRKWATSGHDQVTKVKYTRKGATSKLIIITKMMKLEIFFREKNRKKMWELLWRRTGTTPQPLAELKPEEHEVLIVGLACLLQLIKSEWLSPRRRLVVKSFLIDGPYYQQLVNGP